MTQGLHQVAQLLARGHLGQGHRGRSAAQIEQGKPFQEQFAIR